MKTIPINLREIHFDNIKSGIKTVEVRVNKGKFISAEVGDIFLINDDVKVEIVAKRNYKTFREMFDSEGLQNIVPHINNIDEAIDGCYKYYTKEQEENFGILAFEIKLYEN